MADSAQAQDYFWQSQYGEKNNKQDIATLDKNKDIPSIKTINQREILVKDDKGTSTSVPSIKYVEQLEKQVDQLGEANRTLKAQVQTTQRNIITLDGRIAKLEQLIGQLTNHGNY